MGAPDLLDPQTRRVWLRRFARTTPGVVGAIAFAVAATCLIAGLVGAAQLDARIAGTRTVLDHSEPLAYSAQKLYAALSAADSTAATAFLSAGVHTTEVRARYRHALADAASALADTTAGASDTDTRTALAQISAQLTQYAGLVELAEANNRQTFVVGSSYFREASWLMRSAILPGAKQVYAGNLATLGRDQRAVESAPLADVVLPALALVVIGVGSAILAGRTNRQLNIGLVIAAVLVLVAIGGVGVAGYMAAANIGQSRTEGTDTLARLGNARIAAEQARTDELLELIARTDITMGEANFTGHINELSALIAPRQSVVEGPSVVRDAVAKWTAAHRKQVDSYTGGDYLSAVSQAIGTDPDGSATQFALVEAGLRDEIELTRPSLREQVATAGAWLAWGPTGILTLTLLAAAAGTGGLWPRLKEFL